MTNEIKGIIEALKPHNDIVKEYPLTLSIEEQKLLLDYITDLQEENKQLIENNLSMQEEMCLRWNEIIDLKDTIQNKNDCIGAYDEIIKDRDERIDKANQLIEKQKKKMYKSRNKIAMYILINLENILRGDE